jgi:signal transduction histidine kinase
VDAQIVAALQRLVLHLGVERGGLAELQPDQKQLVITHSFNLPGVTPHPHLILDEQLPWYARTIRQGNVLRFANLPDDLPAEASAEREYCRRVGLQSHVMIPLNIKGSVIGAIGFGAFRKRRDWPDDLVQRLRLVGEVFTNVLARKRSEETLRNQDRALRQTNQSINELIALLIHAQEEERRRVAREMHDDWTQRLAILAIEASVSENQLDPSSPGRAQLQHIREALVTLSEDVHALSRQLHPAILDDLGLVEALRSECASFSRREGIVLDYRPHEPPPGVSKEAALCLYRAAQEALRNVARHAGVNEARMSLTTDGSELVLVVQDRGVGFEPAARQLQPGIGLYSMGERVRLVRGVLAVRSSPGRGTTVEVRVPVARSES